jgi:hypothetical protein
MFSLARTLFSPGSAQDRSSLFVRFIDSMVGPPIPLSTLQVTPRDATCKTEGQDGVAVSNAEIGKVDSGRGTFADKPELTEFLAACVEILVPCSQAPSCKE